MDKFLCPMNDCPVEFSSKDHLTRHVKDKHEKTGKKQCTFCDYQGRGDSVKRHMKRKHQNENPSTALSEIQTEATPDDGLGPPVRKRAKMVSQSAQTDEALESNAVATHGEQSDRLVNIDNQDVDQEIPDPMEVDVNQTDEQQTEEPMEISAIDDGQVAEQETTEPVEQPEDDDEFKPEDYYTKKKLKSFRSRKFHTWQSDYEFKLKPLPAEDWQVKFMLIFEHILDSMKANAAKGSMGKIIIFVKGLEYPLSERVEKLSDLTTQRLLERLERVLNSNEGVDLTEGFKINMVYTEMPKGGTGARGDGRPGPYHSRRQTDDDDYETKKRSILNPAGYAKDNLCMSRCLVVAMAMANTDTMKDVDGSPVEFKYLFNWRRPLQKERALQLHEDAGVPAGQKCGLDELKKFQEHLTDYQIILYGKTQLMWRGPEFKDQQLYLRLRDGHYRVINPKMVAGFHVKDHHCVRCQAAWNGQTQHKCGEAPCQLCNNIDCTNTASEIEERICDDCGRTFDTMGCFMAHLKKDCTEKALCPNCKLVIPRGKLDSPGLKPDICKPQPERNHYCLQNKCQFCYEFFMPGHHVHCHVQKPKDKKKKKKDQAANDLADEGIFDLLGEREFEEGYEDDDVDNDGTCRKRGAIGQKVKSSKRRIFGDFESEIRHSYHDPNLLCLEEEDGTKHIYKGKNCVKKFVHDLFNKKEKPKPGQRQTKGKKGIFENTEFFFHNFAGYDSYPILHEVHKLILRPKAIFRGSRLLSLTLPQIKVTFKDTFLHMPMALEAMPKAYGFPNMEKGHFPYKMATKENRKYNGPFPPLEAFDVDNMKTKKRAAVAEWHATESKRYAENPELKYNLPKENEKYCQNDVAIDKQAAGVYQKRMMDIFDGLDPLDKITLPSYCNFVYRKLMMPENSIAIIPPKGYGTVKQSQIAIAWLEWMSKTLGLHIIHGRNSHEVTIGKYKVDGLAFTHSGAPVVFEFHGCYYHGHKCILDRTKTCKGQTMDERDQYTKDKEDFITGLGYKLIRIYQCGLMEEMAENEEMLEFIPTLEKKLKETEPLNPRNALKGGRTNAIRKFYTPKAGESIFYFDINSLYPSVNFSTNGELWPIGHPDNYLHSFPPIEEIFGIIKGTFKPPDRLFHPVLGVSSNSKLVFGLCQTCMDEQATEYCTHTDEQRYIKGEFVSEEVKLALQKGYELVSIDEVWHWPKDRRSENLFRPFIARAYREKVEASGWPAKIEKLIKQLGVDHPDVVQKKQEHVDMYKPMGVHIRPEFVEKNPARRQAAKLVLNNFWGFWAKNNNPDQTTYIETLEQFYRYMTDKDVGSHYAVNKEIRVMHWKEKDHMEKADGKSNVILGAFTTAYARMRLHGFLETVGDRCLYMDTDSVIWIDRPGEPGISTGDELGQMKDEILEEYGSNATIGAYGGAGCKTYALMIVDKETGEVIDYKRKMKGVTPTYKVDQKLPAEKLLDLIQKEYSVKVPQRTLRRDKVATTLRWTEAEKIVRSTFSKRLPQEDITDATDPIGSRPLQE